MSQNNADNKLVTLSPTPKDVSVIHKATVGIEVKINRLKETMGIDLTNNEANVFLVINTSCTVDDSVYTNTEMQKILTRLLALGQRFSPDGSVKIFSAGSELTPINIGNYYTYISTEITGKNLAFSSNPLFAKNLQQCVSNFEGNNINSFGIFITDTDVEDTAETEAIIKEAEKSNIYFQFVGIKDANYENLKRLNDEATSTNTSFIQFKSFKDFTNIELYEIILGGYPEWLKENNLIK